MTCLGTTDPMQEAHASHRAPLALPQPSPATSIYRTGRPLALLNVLRGDALALPRGETSPPPSPPASPPGRPHRPAAHTTPLWFGILKEAEVGGGQHMGLVGGRIVAETLLRMARYDRNGAGQVRRGRGSCLRLSLVTELGYGPYGRAAAAAPASLGPG